MDAKGILSLIPEGPYDPSEIVLIGSHMYPTPNVQKSGKKAGKLSSEDKSAMAKGTMTVRSDFVKQLDLTAVASDLTDTDSLPTMALIFAYGYEGHAYRLPKPRIMIVRGHGEPYEATKDEDNSEVLSGQLYMWRHSKHDQTISIEVESGDLEKLVLEANQPGNRAVNSYSAHMQMSHRGGKLS
ncbi:hypothetical protein [Primorskyibacter sp. S187A]|uniref:hypothetical protein n=1 Tax=Primorskyibacter sp. S187A TaxID=3415130 RepID=UPI003C7C1415